MRYAKHKMNDFQYIRLKDDGYRRLRATDVAAVHADHVDWLTSELAKPFAGQTYVVTHHAPHPDMLRDQMGDLDAAYTSDLSVLIMQYQPTAWYSGHTHSQRDTIMGRTSILDVSLGYPQQVFPEEEARVLMRGYIDNRD